MDENKDERQQCKGCVYWMTASGTDSGEYIFCHYMLFTGKRRAQKDGVCYSRKPGQRMKVHKRRQNPFTVKM